MSKTGIYIHFPFCRSKCKYCNFNSYAGKENRELDYIQALIKEIKSRADKKIIVDTIFMGGGTPSIMFDGCISTIMSVIRQSFTVEGNAEITIECNPNSVTPTKAREWKECGVNRVSIGLQTTNDASLRLIGRAHTRKDYFSAIDSIKTAGFTNISTDCLIGLPKQKMSTIRYMLRTLVKLGCTHISVYSLILEEGTPLYDMVQSGQLKLPKEEKTLGMYNYALTFLRQSGYNRYEVSNFAKTKYECRHNMNTWLMHKYLGFGAGAHGYYDNIRYSNVQSIEEYIEKINKNGNAIDNSYELSDTEKLEDTIMLGLRTEKGISLKNIQEEYGTDLIKTKANEIKELKKLGLIEISGDYLFATDLGFTVLNKVILDLV